MLQMVYDQFHDHIEILQCFMNVPTEIARPKSFYVDMEFTPGICRYLSQGIAHSVVSAYPRACLIEILTFLLAPPESSRWITTVSQLTTLVASDALAQEAESSFGL